MFVILRTMKFLIWALVLFTFPPAISGARASEIQRHVENVPFGERSIRCEIFEPRSGEQKGTILFLHGIGGTLGDGPMLRGYARGLAAAGFRAVIPSYFQATGHWFITPGMAHRDAERWVPVIQALIEHYSQQAPDGTVGIVGYSMGVFLSLGASRNTPGQINALVSLSGGILEKHEEEDWSGLPRLLIVHGGQDRIVPPERAEALFQIAKQNGIPVHYVRNERQGHHFRSKARKDVLRRLIAFFEASSSQQ